MPIHSHPVLRNRDKAMEQVGLAAAQNSDGYQRVVDAENAGIRPTEVPVAWSVIWNGRTYTAAE